MVEELTASFEKSLRELLEFVMVLCDASSLFKKKYPIIPLKESLLFGFFMKL